MCCEKFPNIIAREATKKGKIVRKVKGILDDHTGIPFQTFNDIRAADSTSVFILHHFFALWFLSFSLTANLLACLGLFVGEALGWGNGIWHPTHIV